MGRFFFTGTLAVAVLTSAAVPSAASAQDFSAGRIIDRFNHDTLVTVVTEMGGTVEESPNDGWLIRFPNGTAATANFTVCDDETEQSCLGTSIAGRFAKPTDMSDAEIAALVTDYNARWSAGKSYMTEDGRPVVQTYIIADGGITMENYRMQLVVYADMLQKMSDTIYGE